MACCCLPRLGMIAGTASAVGCAHHVSCRLRFTAVKNRFARDNDTSKLPAGEDTCCGIIVEDGPHVTDSNVDMASLGRSTASSKQSNRLCFVIEQQCNAIVFGRYNRADPKQKAMMACRTREPELPEAILAALHDDVTGARTSDERRTLLALFCREYSTG